MVHLVSIIEKSPDKNEWCVYSETKKNKDGSRRGFGCYPSKKQANERLGQVEFFKHSSSAAIAIEHAEFVVLASKLHFPKNPTTASINAGIVDWVKSLPSKFKDAGAFIEKSVQSLKVNGKQLIEILKNTKVYQFFKEFHFDFGRIIDAIKSSLKLMDKLMEELTKFLHSIGVVNKTVNITTDILKKVDNFLDHNPTFKKLSGIVLAGLLLYVSMNGAFIGSISDFSLFDVLDAASGNLSLTEALGGTNGLKLLINIALGLSGISLAYGLPNVVHFAPSAIAWIYKKLKH